jgi:hypothetical protein
MWSIFIPVVILVGLTLSLPIFLGAARAKDTKADPDLFSRAALDSTQFGELSRKREANLRNLLELPVLFYVAAVFAVLFGATSFWTGLLAWVFVLSRIAHTVIHTTINVVMIRFAAYAVGLVALLLLWITLIFEAGDSLVFDIDEWEERRELAEERREALGLDLD